MNIVYFSLFNQMTEEKNGVSQFILKLLDMLNTYHATIGWNYDFTQVEIKDLKKVTQQILPKYFRHAKFQSFVRQLNMYKFYKVFHEKQNVISFKNDLFFKGNEANFCKIKRKKKNQIPTKTSHELDQNIQFIINHSNLNKPIKNILTDLLELKFASQNQIVKFSSLLYKLAPEMKAAKFRKYESALSSIHSSAQILHKTSCEIQELLNHLRQFQIGQFYKFASEKAGSYYFNVNKPGIQLSISQSKFRPISNQSFEDYFGQKMDLKSPSIQYQIQNFLSATKFLGINEENPQSQMKIETKQNTALIQQHQENQCYSLENDLSIFD